MCKFGHLVKKENKSENNDDNQSDGKEDENKQDEARTNLEAGFDLNDQQMDEQLEVDPNYDNMVETYDGAVDMAEKVMNNVVEEDIKSMFDDLEEILDTESKKDE